MSPQNSKDDVNPNGGSPTFITPKKDQTVRVVLDFRRLYKMLVRKPFPLPKISSTLMQLKGFTYATALDLNMGYYTIRIDAKASEMCTIIFPWGKYSYQRLPMGISGAPDIFQGCMSDLMEDLMYVGAYLDDLLIITSGRGSGPKNVIFLNEPKIIYE